MEQIGAGCGIPATIHFVESSQDYCGSESECESESEADPADADISESDLLEIAPAVGTRAPWLGK